MKKLNDAQRCIPELKELYQAGRISRREFLRNATLLGMSLIGANASLTAFGTIEEAKAGSKPKAIVGKRPTMVKASDPIHGGTIRIASQVQETTHPAQISSMSQGNQLRQVAEYLTCMDENNITQPHLLESWAANGDLTIWTLNLRQGITFNNGDEFTADDVIFSFEQWLSPDVGSSMLGLMSYLSPANIERVNDHTVRLHLDRAEIAVPEHLTHYPALVLNHRTFEGDFIAAPHGTGPYTLGTYLVGERILFNGRDDYWQTGAGGESLPYLDQLEFIDKGEDMSAWIEAIRAVEVDILDPSATSDIGIYQALKDERGINLLGVPTAATPVLRMRVDLDPWTNNQVRQALKLCQDRQRILNLAYFGEGLQGHDCHVAPIHPEYCQKPIPAYDPDQAGQLLIDAGYPSGLDVVLTVGDWPDVVSYAQALQQDAAPAGFNITLNVVSQSEYWSQWTEVDLGITPWSQRPLGTMVLNLAYAGDGEGNPLPWNETHWVDEEFSDLLAQANGTLDVEERRLLMCQLEQIQMDRGSVGVAFWRNTWFVCRDSIHGIMGQPDGSMSFDDVWKGARVYLPMVATSYQLP